MGFKPITKKENTEERVSLQVELTGEKAAQFKKMCEEAKISGKKLTTQMVIYCLDNADTGEAKK